MKSAVLQVHQQEVLVTDRGHRTLAFLTSILDPFVQGYQVSLAGIRDYYYCLMTRISIFMVWFHLSFFIFVFQIFIQIWSNPSFLPILSSYSSFLYSFLSFLPFFLPKLPSLLPYYYFFLYFTCSFISSFFPILILIHPFFRSILPYYCSFLFFHLFFPSSFLHTCSFFHSFLSFLLSVIHSFPFLSFFFLPLRPLEGTVDATSVSNHFHPLKHQNFKRSV